jgi:hypothetical protein
MRKINCIQINVLSGHCELEIMISEMAGFYKYKMIPLELGYEPQIIYISPNRERYIMHGKELDKKNILHSFIYR